MIEYQSSFYLHYILLFYNLLKCLRFQKLTREKISDSRENKENCLYKHANKSEKWEVSNIVVERQNVNGLKIYEHSGLLYIVNLLNNIFISLTWQCVSFLDITD